MHNNNNEQNETDLSSEPYLKLLHGDNENSKNVYKQAFNISKTNLVSPKIKRINENVTKIYGFEDPPPGFGFSYPRFYFIEQKKPQPMNPLKVWRGYNGNVYFEPIQLNKIYNHDEKSSKCEQCLKAVKTKQIYVSSHQIKEDNKPKSSSTKEREHFIGRIDLNKSVENGFPNNLKAVRDKRSLNLKPIVPNLAAVKKTNVPMKGLAYKESKEKIDSNPKMLQTSDLNREASDLNVYIYYDIDSKTTKREFSCSKNREKSGNIHKGFTYRMNQNEFEKHFGEYPNSKDDIIAFGNSLMEPNQRLIKERNIDKNEEDIRSKVHIKAATLNSSSLNFDLRKRLNSTPTFI